MRDIAQTALAVLSALVIGVLVGGEPLPGIPPDPALLSPSVRVVGAVQQALTLGPEWLASRQPSSVESRWLDGKSGQADDPVEVRGVRLSTVLDWAGVTVHSDRDRSNLLVLALGRDGQRIVLPWADIVDPVRGRGWLVIFERHGQPLGPDEGRLALVSTASTAGRPVHVGWLSTLEVRAAHP